MDDAVDRHAGTQAWHECRPVAWKEAFGTAATENYATDRVDRDELNSGSRAGGVIGAAPEGAASARSAEQVVDTGGGTENLRQGRALSHGVLKVLVLIQPMAIRPSSDKLSNATKTLRKELPRLRIRRVYYVDLGTIGVENF